MATVNHTNVNPYKVNKNNFRALRDDVIVEEMAFKERTLSSGIILLDDDAKEPDDVRFATAITFFACL